MSREPYRKGGEPDAAGDDQHDRQDAHPRAGQGAAQPREHGAAVGEVDAHEKAGDVIRPRSVCASAIGGPRAAISAPSAS